MQTIRIDKILFMIFVVLMCVELLEEQNGWESSWRELPNEEFFGRASELFSSVEPLIRIPPLAPERGETGRIVAVLRRMPKQTVTRVTRVWNPLLLRIMISIGLRALRRAAVEESAG